MKIIFIGCVETSYAFLKELLDNQFDVVGVITKKDSVFNADFTDVTPLCKEYDIPIIYVKSINDEDTKEFIRNRGADIGYCFGWSQLVKEDVIDMFPRGMVGYHPAALPSNRGRHPVIWALVLGLNKTASSFFMLEKTADTGSVISQKEVDISYDDDARSLMDKLLSIGSEQVVELSHMLETNNEKYVSQKVSEGNSWRKRGKCDGKIDWRMSSRCIYNLVRALTKPYVGAHFEYSGFDVKVWKVREVIDRNKKYLNIEPGKIIEMTDDSVIVKAGEDMIELLEYEKNLVDFEVGDYL